MAISHDSLTRSITSAQWYEELNLVSSDTLSMQFMPTLYDIIADEYCSRRLPKRDSVAAAWLAFHEHDASVLPRLYITLNRLNTEYGNKLLDMYDSLPAGWERGYVLLHLKAYGNGQYYRYLSGYLAQFPDSPFAPDILRCKQLCEQIKLDYSYPDLLSTADSITISYSNTNAREIIFELYRLPDKLPKRAPLGTALVKVDSLRVTTDTPLVFSLDNRQCKMAPQSFGTYYIYARLPEDSLQPSVESLSYARIYHRTFTVSDLRCFLLQEGQMKQPRPWVIVSDIHSGQPVQHVKVKPYKHLARTTNRQGETKVPKRRADYQLYQFLHGTDKYYKTFLSYSSLSAKETNLTALPNATVFRPGDTLHIAFIGQKRHGFRYSLPKNKRVRVSFSGPQWKRADTTLVLDEYATATLAVPFTEDMRRGFYCVFARMDDSYAASVGVRLEDYRLPSFSVALDDSCSTMQRSKLTPLTGKALRTDGMPLAGARVTATLAFDRYGFRSHTLYPLDTVTTAPDGTFRFMLPADLVAARAVHDILFVKAYATSSDGETQNAHMQIALKGNVPSRPKPLYVAGVPQDSLLWLPEDSMTINGREATLRLGVPRTSWVYCVASSRSSILSHRWQLLQPGMHAYTFTLPDKTDDYLDVRFMTCREDGLFIERHHHMQGVSRTALHIVPVTMRDYLTPGTRETWTFRLTDAQGKPQQGNMVLNMTDQALESLNSSLWKNRLMPKWQFPFTGFSTPQHYSRSQHITSHIPSAAKGFYTIRPVLYGPYRVDSARLVVIYGKVVDAQGEPVVGASVTEQGTKHGTISDYDGCFSLAVAPDAVIECAFIGMKTVACPVYGNMYIVMEDNQEELSEVVVTGYGKSKANGVRIRGVGSIRAAEVETLGIAEEEEDVAYCVVANVAPSPDTASVPVLRQGDTRLALFLPALQTDAAGEIHVHFITPPDNTEWLMQATAWTANGNSDYITRTCIARRTLMLRLPMPRFMREGDTLSLPCIISNTADTARQTSLSLQIRDALTDSLLASFTGQYRLAPNASQTLFFPYTATSANSVIVRAVIQDNNGTSDGEQRPLTVLPVVEPVSESLPFYMHASDTLLTLSLPAPANAANRRVTLMQCNNPLAYIAAQLPRTIDSSAVTVTELSHNYYALSLRNKLAERHPSIAPVDISSLHTKLRAYQRYDGGFSWFKNGHSAASYYLSLRVLALLGELQEADALGHQQDYTVHRAVLYIDREAVKREKEYRKAHHDSLPDYADFAQYAFVRAMSKEPLENDAKRIFSATLDSLYARLDSSELTSWPLLALTFERAGLHERALAVLNGLRRYATIDHDHGMYWNNLPDRWWWYRQADLQASFLLAFSRIDPHTEELDALRQWLILNNRTTDWGQSSLNAYVTYVLMSGAPALGQPQDSAVLQYIALPDTVTYYTLRHPAGTPAWGALITSFDAPADQLQPFATKAVKVERRFERSDSTSATASPLAKGERIRVVLALTTDREMDNVILTDRRAALLEPVGTSSFVWQSNTFYYRDIRNTEERFYIEHLSRGTTTFSYECYVTASGTTLAGLASIVSELAPEFTAHTATDALHTQDDTIPADSEQEIFIDTYNVPEFPGGQKALFEYLASNVRYEDLVWDADITGRVVVQFLVQADGSITDIEVVRSLGYPKLDEEAVRVISEMPKWVWKHDPGDSAPMRYTVPVNFKLQ